jgi:uncharacterized protein (DUF697 family)/predicted GTPase
MFRRVRQWLRDHSLEPLSREAFHRERAKLLDATPVPVFWLFGKTGSGKTSIIKYLTQAERAQIGTGFRPETRQSSRYDFPSADQPIIQFLDTRGLGEVGYDPREDIAQFNDAAHLMLVTVRASDHAQDAVAGPLRTIRKAKPDRPVILALTCLHDFYPQGQHPEPDPFGRAPGDEWDRARIPADLLRSIDEQQRRFKGLFDVVMPIDLTLPEDGFTEPNFGGLRLKQALIERLPDAYRQTFLTMTDVMGSLRKLHERQATPFVLGAATMAASAAAVPVPWVDIPAVAGLQSELIRRLAALYGQPLDWEHFLQMAGAVGGRLLIRQAIRETLKIIPVVGQAANATLAFVSTYALGEACCWYYGEKLAGHSPTSAELKEVLKAQTARAEQLWARHHQGEPLPRNGQPE